MAHQIQIQELINGIQITETVDNEIVIKFLSYQGKPFFRTTNETDEETYQIIDKVGEIYNLPALATEFVLIDINDVVYIPANGAELIEYSVKLKPFRSETEEDQSHIGTITTTANSLTINLADDGVNWAKINGSFYERFYPDTFNFVPVTTGQKILIVYAIPDAMPFRLAQGVEGTEAVEPDYDGLFIARILVSSAGQVIEESTDDDDFKLKAESGWRNVIATNTNQAIQMVGTAGTSFNVKVAAGSTDPKIGGLATKLSKNVYPGMEILFRIDSDTPVTFTAGTYTQNGMATSIGFKENYIGAANSVVRFFWNEDNVFELMQSGASFPTGNTGDVLVKTATGEEFSPRLTNAETAITANTTAITANTTAITALGKQVYKTISENVTIDDTYFNAIVWITANCIITVPSTLRADFTCVFDTVGNITATFTEGTSTTFSAPFGKILRNNRMCTLAKRTATQYRLNGNLATV